MCMKVEKNFHIMNFASPGAPDIPNALVISDYVLEEKKRPILDPLLHSLVNLFHVNDILDYSKVELSKEEYTKINKKITGRATDYPHEKFIIDIPTTFKIWTVPSYSNDENHFLSTVKKIRSHFYGPKTSPKSYTNFSKTLSRPGAKGKKIGIINEDILTLDQSVLKNYLIHQIIKEENISVNNENRKYFFQKS